MNKATRIFISIIITLLIHIGSMLYFIKYAKFNTIANINKNESILELDFTKNEIKEKLKELMKSNEYSNEELKNIARDLQSKSDKQTSDNFEPNINNNNSKSDPAEDLINEVLNERRNQNKAFNYTKYREQIENIENEKQKNIKEINKKYGSEPTTSNIKGKVTCECNVPDRKCKPSIPAYRCKSSGEIYIKIFVNQKGQVINIKVDESLSSYSENCLKEEAVIYARKAWINQDFNDQNIKEGYIIYNFESQ